MRPEPKVAWQRWAQRCDDTLTTAIADRGGLNARLDEAMAYACLHGGKRMRPLLVYATGTTLGAHENDLDAAAAAVELVHAYSLVHDDLPAMDNDSLRRGKPTVHVAYGEATAILAGDALLTLAFELLGDSGAAAPIALGLITTLARAGGLQGMAAGQAIDLDVVGQTLALDELRAMHAAKTGALIRASVAMGAQVAGADATSLSILDDYASAFGLAFQIRDDILDVEGESAALGKTAGKDAAQAKPTYPALLGLGGSRELVSQLRARMHEALARLDIDTRELAALADYAAQRNH